MGKIIGKLRTVLANRRAYNYALLEIKQLDAQELADINVDRDVLIAGAYHQVYGAQR